MAYNAREFLPYGRQSIDDTDLQAVAQALRSDFLTTGPLVEQFEAALCEASGAAHMVAVSNGTAALHLSVAAQDLGPEDAVIVPAVTFAATANAVAYCGARVIFADIDASSGLMTAETFEEARHRLEKDHPFLRFAGVMPVHLGGHAVDLNDIATLTHAMGGFVIEDAAHALGSIGAQGRVGMCSNSNAACFSFHPVKTITTGEGGAIATPHAGLARRLKALRSHGIERDPARFSTLGQGKETAGAWLYEMQALGFNYRLPDINCALGLSQVQKLGGFASRRKALAAAYHQHQALMRLPLRFQTGAGAYDPVLHLMVALIEYEAVGLTRQMVMQGLKNRGIGTQVHYIPVPDMPYWQSHALSPRPLPGAQAWYAQALSLPLYPDMNEDDPHRVMSALAEVLS